MLGDLKTFMAGRTVICNEGVWVAGDHPQYPLAPHPVSFSSLMATVIQNTTRIMTLALETGLVVCFLMFIYCWLNPVLLFRSFTSGRAAPSPLTQVAWFRPSSQASYDLKNNYLVSLPEYSTVEFDILHFLKLSRGILYFFVSPFPFRLFYIFSFLAFFRELLFLLIFFFAFLCFFTC